MWSTVARRVASLRLPERARSTWSRRVLSSASVAAPSSDDAGEVVAPQYVENRADFRQYYDALVEARESPETFWSVPASRLHWHEPYSKVLDSSRAPFYQWFDGGRCNICYNAIDRHVSKAGGRASQPALIYDSPYSGARETFTYADLLYQVSKFGGVLRSFGVQKGDTVTLYMPMIPQAIIAMLACARIGAIHAVVFGGFAAKELGEHIRSVKPKVVVSASCGIEPSRIVQYKPILDKALELSQHRPNACIIYQRPHQHAPMTARDVDWQAEMAKSEHTACEAMNSTDPLYILRTSGTTGDPKGVYRDHGGYMVALDWSMDYIYGMNAGDTFWAASDIGWVVGHSYIVYAPLIHGCTTVLYEGKPVGTPDAGAFWRVIQEHRVKTLFTSPTSFRVIRKEDPRGKLIPRYNLEHFKYLFLAGERADSDTVKWAESVLQRPVVDHYWQTETGWPVISNFMGFDRSFPTKYGSSGKTVPGYDIRVLDDTGHEVAPGTMGKLMFRLPLPPGSLPSLWKDNEGYKRKYLSDTPGFYTSGDAGYIDMNGYVNVMARIDDIINCAGHRLSTGAIEEALASHPSVAECAVVGIRDSTKGELPFGLLVTKAGVARDTEAQLVSEAITLVREAIGPVASFKLAIVVPRLPKTRSGKILRRLIRQIANGEQPTVPPTIEDATVLDELKEAIESIGLPSINVPEMV